MVKLQKGPGKVKTNKEQIGIGALDIGKFKHYCYVKSKGGEELNVFEFQNNYEGAMLLMEKLEGFSKSAGLSKIRLGVESTGSYGEPITAWLRSRKIEVVGINPKHVHRVKEVVDNSPGKTDKKDPKVGTMLVELNKTHQLICPEGISAELRNATKHRTQLKENETRLKNQLESQVARIFPEFLSLMKGLRSKTSLYLLENYPTPEQIVGLGESALSKILRRESCYQLGLQRAKALYNGAKNSIGIKSGVSAISLAIKDLIQQLRLVQQQIKQAELLLEGLVGEHQEAQYLLSVPKMGIITVSELIGETGGLNNYSSAEKLIKLAGLNLYEISSGMHRGKKRISKRGRARLRQSLYLAALRMIQKHAIYEKHYKKYIQTMKKPQAVIAVAKKLLRTLFSLVKNQQLFDPKVVK